MTKVSDISYEAQQAVEAMKSQLLIVLINRLGAKVAIPVEEIDGTGKFVLTMRVEERNFHFEVQRKDGGPPPPQPENESPESPDYKGLNTGKPRTVDEAAKILGIGRNQAYEAARSGQLPCVRIGRRILVSEEGLKRLLRGDQFRRGKA
jgi:excisionase family DNA binding protein